MAGEKFIALEETSQEIKTAVEGVSTSVTELKEDVGDGAGTDLVARVANLATRVSNLQTAVEALASSGGGAIKSIQRGRYIGAGNALKSAPTEKTVTINTVEPDKAFVLLTDGASGAYVDSFEEIVTVAHSYVTAVNANNFKFIPCIKKYKYSSSRYYYEEYSTDWWVIEFV